MDYFATYWYREIRPSPHCTISHETYNEAVDRIASGGENGIRIHEIAPDEPLKSDGYQVQVDSLWADYHLGLARAWTWWPPASPEETH